MKRVGITRRGLVAAFGIPLEGEELLTQAAAPSCTRVMVTRMLGCIYPAGGIHRGTKSLSANRTWTPLGCCWILGADAPVSVACDDM